jgi:hypothetical protein
MLLSSVNHRVQEIAELRCLSASLRVHDNPPWPQSCLTWTRRWTVCPLLSRSTSFPCRGFMRGLAQTCHGTDSSTTFELLRRASFSSHCLGGCTTSSALSTSTPPASLVHEIIPARKLQSLLILRRRILHNPPRPRQRRQNDLPQPNQINLQHCLFLRRPYPRLRR